MQEEILIAIKCEEYRKKDREEKTKVTNRKAKQY